MTTYTTHTQESTAVGGALTILGNENYQLQLAKSVTNSSGSVTYNMVYQSQLLAPDMEIQWTANYGLNWAANSPNPGATVNYAGNWQPCAAGESYDLNNVGAWVPNQSNPNAKPNCLNVGNNDYGESVYISVRVQDASGNWSPIWVSPDKLVQQSGGEYEPLEAITLWYQEGSQTSTMVSTQ
ncbi:hypothetical protein FOPG_07026 [Fusarium oxysporum f. sp. conglutinans race 2 54008]|uniref:Uncharacterized protein n=3 Tax=Fusarium oxysporum f. sp. conglutinans TaxID=100902 RepID=A0A8H6H6T0_FUSOX|nr:hypothetical protein FOXB_01672 [Fusarium oxysporum f. sp. conglutinans Fo5176]EXL79046.1 hypothetical protein FOPG_07026 [Fusarium oxysporum f. sp. conglutinans race 2 54008]KAF6530376.1 hypothetical protein HZS61_001688 [Fusarium oxysporum f. sp. conglutinans]KAG6992330.1 hypothetical protein FocnCong_v017804 [Fusarium oxysporum f. sp. conglutinans]KAI8417704.1 hypothetical protein FOFC_00259 [Fusarium oxysporum]